MGNPPQKLRLAHEYWPCKDLTPRTGKSLAPSSGLSRRSTEQGRQAGIKELSANHASGEALSMEASREFSRTPRRLPPRSDVSVLQKTRMSHFWDTHHKIAARKALLSLCLHVLDNELHLIKQIKNNVIYVSYQCRSSHAFVGVSWASNCCGFILRVTHHHITAQFAHTALASHSHFRPRPPLFLSSPSVPAQYGPQAAAERATGASRDQLYPAGTRLTDLRLRFTSYARSRTQIRAAPAHGVHVRWNFADDDGCAALLRRTLWRVRGV